MHTHLLFLDSIGGGELMVVMLFVLMFFGSEKIPDIAKGLGKGMREFKAVMNGVQSEIEKGVSQAEKHIENEVNKLEIKPPVNAVQKVEAVKQELAAAASLTEEKTSEATTAATEKTVGTETKSVSNTIAEAKAE